MKKCRFCAEEIQDAAIVCKHCGRDLVPGRTSRPPAKVTVTGADPFAAYHTPIQGKKDGAVTPVGYLGVGLGGLILFAGLATMFSGTVNQGGGAFGLCVLGVLVAVGSYLWVRR